MPIAPPRMRFPAIAPPPVPPNLLSTLTVCGAYPGLLTVTLKGSVFRSLTNFTGVTPCSPVESLTSAPDGSLVTLSLSWTPRVIVAHEVKHKSGRNNRQGIFILGVFDFAPWLVRPAAQLLFVFRPQSGPKNLGSRKVRA